MKPFDTLASGSAPRGLKAFEMLPQGAVASASVSNAPRGQKSYEIRPPAHVAMAGLTNPPRAPKSYEIMPPPGLATRGLKSGGCGCGGKCGPCKGFAPTSSDSIDSMTARMAQNINAEWLMATVEHVANTGAWLQRNSNQSQQPTEAAHYVIRRYLSTLPVGFRNDVQASVANLSDSLAGMRDPYEAIGNSIRYGGDPCQQLANEINNVRAVVDTVAARSPDLAAIAHWYRTCLDVPGGGAHPDPCTQLHRLYDACSSAPWTCGARMRARDDCTTAWGRLEANATGNGSADYAATLRRECRERARHAAAELFGEPGVNYLYLIDQLDRLDSDLAYCRTGSTRDRPTMHDFANCVSSAVAHGAAVNVLVTFLFGLLGDEQASAIGYLANASALYRSLRGCGIVF